jgi:ribosome recycling factor
MDRLIAQAKADMEKTVQVVTNEIAAFRTGRASTGLVENLEVDYYGEKVQLNQIASIQVIDARLLGITPWDKNAMAGIDKAIMTSDLGLMPTNDGNIIRLEIPSLTEERREELSRQVNKRLEEGRVAIRNIRRSANESMDKRQDDEGWSDDEVHVGKEEIQELTDEHIEAMEDIAEAKIEEIKEI